MFDSNKLGKMKILHGGNGLYLDSLFDLFSLSLGVGLGLTVDLEPPHLLHQASHIVEELLLARIVHLEETVYRYLGRGSRHDLQGSNFQCLPVEVGP